MLGGDTGKSSRRIHGCNGSELTVTKSHRKARDEKTAATGKGALVLLHPRAQAEGKWYMQTSKLMPKKKDNLKYSI